MHTRHPPSSGERFPCACVSEFFFLREIVAREICCQIVLCSSLQRLIPSWKKRSVRGHGKTESRGRGRGREQDDRGSSLGKGGCSACVSSGQLVSWPAWCVRIAVCKCLLSPPTRCTRACLQGMFAGLVLFLSCQVPFEVLMHKFVVFVYLILKRTLCKAKFCEQEEIFWSW